MWIKMLFLHFFEKKSSHVISLFLIYMYIESVKKDVAVLKYRFFFPFVSTVSDCPSIKVLPTTLLRFKRKNLRIQICSRDWAVHTGFEFTITFKP